MIYEFSPRPNDVVYDLVYPYDIAIFILQTLSLIGIIWAVSAVEVREFLGISQIKRWFDSSYNVVEGDERLELNLKGAFLYCRHPIYFFFILFLGLRPTMDVFYLTFYICIVVYFIVGAYFEEQRLVLKFGKRYAEYRELVPMFIPYKKLKAEDINRILETETP